MTGTVLEEGLRGAGGHLLNGAEKRFMLDYDAAGERATRDVVSRGIYAEMRKSNISPMGGVFIDMRHVENTVARFPGMVKRCADCGFDLANGIVEVVPTAHYMMGGVEVEADTSTTMPGLFIAGEDAGGVHGANRLGGNGVANSTVFGGIAGEEMARWCVQAHTLRDSNESVIEEGIARTERPFSLPPGDLHGLRDRLSQMMWDKVGILRTERMLTEALSDLSDFRAELAQTGLADGDRAFNLTWHDWMNVESLIDTSEVITRAALVREDSRGAHFREDFPETGDLEATAYTQVRQTSDGLQIDTIPVTFDIVKPGESLIDGAVGAPTAAE